MVCRLGVDHFFVRLEQTSARYSLWMSSFSRDLQVQRKQGGSRSSRVDLLDWW